MSIDTPAPRRLRRRLSALLVVGAAALVVAGCGDDGEADLANGKTLFTQQCGGCHVLEDAGTKGVQGPNLDDAFRASRQAGFEESQFEGVVHRWIRDAQPPMPQDIVTGQDARDVAAYVASVAGTSEASASKAGSGYPEEEVPVTFETD